MEKVLTFRINEGLESEIDCEEMEIKVNEFLDKGWTVKDIRIDRGITVFVLDDSNVTEQESDAEDEDDGMLWY